MNVTRNIAANVAGRVWVALMNFAFVPFYIHALGIEAYGLIGFFVSLMAIFLVLDMGLSTAINREMARRESGAAQMEARDLARTLELLYWALGVGIGFVVVLLAPVIARDWLAPQGLSADETAIAVRLMGIIIIFRWPVPLYSGALMGLGRQVTLNLVTSMFATVQGAGAVLVLWLLSPTISGFFMWQLVAAVAQVLALRWLMWRSLVLPGHRARFSGAALRAVMLFSAGVMGITLLSVVLTQLDKLVLSRLLPLDDFGYYALAGTIANTLSIGATAIYGAAFPAFSQLVADGREPDLRRQYHHIAQILSVFVLPAGIAIALFSPELLSAYLRDATIVGKTHMLLSLLVVGNMLLALMVLPLALQFAYGWTRLSLYKNMIAVLLFVPALWFMVGHYGPVGAALVWIALTVGYVSIEVPVMHRRLLPGAHWRWYAVDVGVPAVISIVILASARWLLPIGSSVVTIAVIVIATVLSAGASAIAMPETRRLAIGMMRRLPIRWQTVS